MKVEISPDQPLDDISLEQLPGLTLELLELARRSQGMDDHCAAVTKSRYSLSRACEVISIGVP